MNIPAADNMVGEYLIYRGFTQTYKALESEKNRDKTKQFEVARIVEVSTDSKINVNFFLSKSCLVIRNNISHTPCSQSLAICNNMKFTTSFRYGIF